MNNVLTGSLSLLAATAFTLGSVGSASAAPYSYRYAYVHHVSGELQLQRATESDPELGEINIPLVPGDRLWTNAGSRAEIRFADGTILRMDEFTKVDLVDFDAEQAARIWNGSVIVILAEPRANVRIDTPSGSIYPAEDGHFRIDVRNDQTTTLSVNRGVAELVSDAGSVLVRGGQRSVLEPGQRPDSPFSFNTAHYDEFDYWSDEQDRYATTTHEIPGELPDEVHHYAGNLAHHGEWQHDDSYGYVWYPHVDVGWAPYRYGRWRHTHFGYTWISYEPWGWAPYHYGRWGYGVRGWYWIPGAYWGPAWVSWAFGPDWLGWSPLGYYDRPVFVFNTFLGGRGGRYRGGKAVPRHVFDSGAGWNFTRNRDFQRGGSASVRLRAADVRLNARGSNVRLLESGAVLERGLKPRAVGGAEVSRLVGTTPLTPARVRARDLDRGQRGAGDRVRGGGVTSRSRTPAQRANTIRNRGGGGAPSTVQRERAVTSRGGGVIRNDGGGERSRSLTPRTPVLRGGTETATTRGTIRDRSTSSSREGVRPRSIEGTQGREPSRQPSGTVRERSGTVPGGSRVIRTPRTPREPSSNGSPSRVINRRQRERTSSSGIERTPTSRRPTPRTSTPLRSRGREFFERSGSTERNRGTTPRVRSRSRNSSPGSSPARVNRPSRGSRSSGSGTMQRGRTIQRSNPGRAPRQPSVRSRSGSSRGSQGAVRGGGGSNRGSNRGAATTRKRSNRSRPKN